MHNETQIFIQQARQRGLSDVQIGDMLRANGWAEPQIQSALLGLAVPMAPTSAPAAMPAYQPAHKEPGRRSINALEAALQHILLWIFTGTSTIFIGVVSAALFSSGSSSSNLLITFLVVEAVTFIPFAALFVLYLRRQRRDAELATGKVWSIITIVLHSLGVMSSLITLILVLALLHSDARTPVVISSGTILVMDLAVVLAYVMANFVKPQLQFRSLIIRLLPVVLFAIICFFGIVSALQIGPLRADDQTRQHLVSATQAVSRYAVTNKKLPSTLAVAGYYGGDGVTYTVQASDTYEMCANFRRGLVNGYNSSSSSPAPDDVVDDSSFMPKSSGQQCFQFQSTAIPNANPIYNGTVANPVQTYNN